MVPAWAPVVEDVHGLIPHRNGGQPWDRASQPTATQVFGLIEGRAAEVLGALGGSLPEALEEQAAHVVKLGVAADIELGYQSHPSGDGDSAGPSLLDRYETSMSRLVANAESIRRKVPVAPATATAHAAPWGVQPARPPVRIWDRG